MSLNMSVAFKRLVAFITFSPRAVLNRADSFVPFPPIVETIALTGPVSFTASPHQRTYRLFPPGNRRKEPLTASKVFASSGLRPLYLVLSELKAEV